jgi:UDP-glucose 6-dehydrogenase
MEKVTVSVTPGICGFVCRVTATRKSKRVASIEVIASECKMINELAAGLLEVSLDDLFKPHTRNLIFKCTEQAHCHLCCPVPIAIIKASEVALELALPQDVLLHFV